jgi:hypothetical protein
VYTTLINFVASFASDDKTMGWWAALTSIIHCISLHTVRHKKVIKIGSMDSSVMNQYDTE